MHYVICYTEDGIRKWENISGEDAMHQFISDLADTEPLVFEMDDEIDNKY